MALPDGFDPNDPWCPKCNQSAMYDNRATKRNPKQPDFKCKDKGCNNAIWERSRGEAPPPRQAAPQQQRQASAPPPQGRPTVAFDEALSSGHEAIAVIGAAMADIAKQQGLSLTEPTVAAAWFASVASVACTLLIAASDGKFRIGEAPAEPAAPVSPMTKWKRALDECVDPMGVAKCSMAYGADPGLDTLEREELGQYANQRLNDISLAALPG